MSASDAPSEYAPALTGTCTPLQRRIRTECNGHVVADSTDAVLLRESSTELYYMVPEADVRTDLLTDAEDTTSERGRCRYWNVTVGGETAERAAFAYPEEPVDGRPDLRGLVGFEWDAMDAWYEEDERVIGHPRDPFHRIDTLGSSRPIRVALDGVTLAETEDAVFLAETGLPMRYYIPRADVHLAHLEPSDSVWHCPYKGVGTFWHVTVDGERYEDAAWAYDDPLDESSAIAGRIAFYNETVDIYVDGELEATPETQFA